MADHREKQVIDAFISTITGLATAGNNVEAEREFSWGDDVSHAIQIDLGPDDPSGDSEQSWPLVASWTTLAVRLIHKGSKADALGALTLMRAEVEVALMAYHAAQTNPLGLAFVSDIREIGAGPVSTDEWDATESNRTITWRIRYTRSQFDPTQ